MPTADDGLFALVFAPHGRDATIASALLAEAGISSRIQTDVAGLVEGLTDEAGFVVTTIEAIRGADLRALAGRLADQPPWSDIPVILLAQRGGGLERNPEAARLSEALGNVSFLERPFHPTTFVSVAKAALKSRQRQLEARARIDEIREGEASLTTALSAGRLGSWQFTVATGELTASPACKALFGKEPEQAITYDDLVATIHPDDRARVLAQVDRTLATGEDYEIEYRVTPPGKPMRWAEVRARLVRDRHGRPVTLVGVSSDITSRRAAEAALRDAKDLLEQRVAERTAALQRAHRERLAEAEQRERAEALLHQAQKMEMVGQLTGGVAHDFNNLLMAVLGNLELLGKRLPADPRTARLLDGALEGARRGATLTQRLLAFARRQELEVKPRDIVALVRGMADLLERSAGSRIRLRYQLDENVPLAAVDINQVELALMNLVVNARDAMPNGGDIRIAVDAVEDPGSDDLEEGRYVRLQVEDTGAGMDAATLAKATEPFFSTKAVGKGTGLGLSMIQGLAVQLGGALRLTSDVGVGTTACLLLPATDRAAGPAPAIAVEPASTSAGPALQILVVDDDALIAMSTAHMLEDLGHAVVDCNSGEDALAYLRRGSHVDLMITDYAMPQMTGLELARAARDIRPDLPMLLASGFADMPEGDVLDLPRIAKPYMQAQLRAAISSVLSKSKIDGRLPSLT